MRRVSLRAAQMMLLCAAGVLGFASPGYAAETDGAPAPHCDGAVVAGDLTSLQWAVEDAGDHPGACGGAALHAPASVLIELPAGMSGFLVFEVGNYTTRPQLVGPLRLLDAGEALPLDFGDAIRLTDDDRELLEERSAAAYLQVHAPARSLPFPHPAQEPRLVLEAPAGGLPGMVIGVSVRFDAEPGERYALLGMQRAGITTATLLRLVVTASDGDPAAAGVRPVVVADGMERGPDGLSLRYRARNEGAVTASIPGWFEARDMVRPGRAPVKASTDDLLLAGQRRDGTVFAPLDPAFGLVCARYVDGAGGSSYAGTALVTPLGAVVYRGGPGDRTCANGIVANPLARVITASLVGLLLLAWWWGGRGARRRQLSSPASEGSSSTLRRRVVRRFGAGASSAGSSSSDEAAGAGASDDD